MLKYAKLYAKKDHDPPELAFQKQLLAIISSFLLFCGIAWIVKFYLIFGWSIPAYAAAAFVLNAVVAAFIGHRTKNHLILVYAIFYACTLSPLIAQWSMGNLHDSGLVIVWGFLTPLGVLIFTSLRPAIYAMAFFAVCILFTVIFEPQIGPTLTASATDIQVMYSLNIVVSFTVLFITCAWFVYIIKVEKRNADDLLLNILPSDVAEELKKYGKVEPVSHTHATVLFTDFKGFTEISETITPKELVREINHCFGAFDEITTKYNIEKIKTIGDSYMAVGGDFGEEECTPWHVVSAGLEMRDYMRERKLEREKEGKFCFQMRIGVHTGTVISGVVGVKKFQFDIWGDTVNIASRMETNGEIEQMNISQVTHDLIKDDFDFQFRGQIPVKGKGEMNMYFVYRKNEDEPGVSKEVEATSLV